MSFCQLPSVRAFPSLSLKFLLGRPPLHQLLPFPLPYWVSVGDASLRRRYFTIVTAIICEKPENHARN